MRSGALTLLRHLTNILALLGALGVIAMLLHVTVYVIGRQLFSWPVPATVEIVSRYYMVLIAFLPLAWAERRNEMITVDILSAFFKGRLDRINMAFVHLVSFLALAVLTYTTWFAALGEYHSGTFVLSLSIAVPVWPGYFILPLGFALASIVSAVKLYLCVTGREGEPESDRFFGFEDGGSDS